MFFDSRTFDSDPRSGHYPCPTLSSSFVSIKASRKILEKAPNSNADADMFGSELAARTGADYHHMASTEVHCPGVSESLE